MQTLAVDSRVDALNRFLQSIEETLTQFAYFRTRYAALPGDEEGVAVVLRLVEPEFEPGHRNAYELSFSTIETAQHWVARKLVSAHERIRLNSGHAVLERALKLSETELNPGSIQEAMRVLRDNSEQAARLMQQSSGSVLPDRAYRIERKQLFEERRLLSAAELRDFAA